MRTIFIATLFCFVIPFSHSQQKTIANLQEAYKFESENQALFLAYAGRATQDGYPSVALFFKAASSVAGIHAGNYRKALEKMGVQATPGALEQTVTSTGENLQEAFRSVRIESGIKYTEYLEIAKSENQTTAAKALRWAKETHQQSLQMYVDAIDAFVNKKTETLPSLYLICPKCGNLYNIPNPEETCSFCGTEKEKFLKIQ